MYFGWHAGPAAIIVTVPELGLVDTIEFTIDPGAARYVQVLPVDTTVMTGGAILTPRATVLDQFLNVRDDRVTLTTPDGLLTPEAAGGFETSSGTGRTMIVASFDSLRDTTMVSVVPAGVIAAQRQSGMVGIVVANTDGSSLTLLTPTFAHFQWSSLEWSGDARASSMRPSSVALPHCNARTWMARLRRSSHRE